eukprot:CAMPEP_0167752602 /NCGR_PEP_ID=MMETSP0110_2-20121227/7232_1 /TAXON_ID=629695 /ORGANISM="Gymnochlora sp., Strain CCMP2014" /LENGTH=940 /DNA_ID=CAMNT_0007638241 /DNA_START=289 /DNA_END=3108 /DNA_ORIENTATION=+
MGIGFEKEISKSTNNVILNSLKAQSSNEGVKDFEDKEDVDDRRSYQEVKEFEDIEEKEWKKEMNLINDEYEILKAYERKKQRAIDMEDFDMARMMTIAIDLISTEDTAFLKLENLKKSAILDDDFENAKRYSKMIFKMLAERMNGDNIASEEEESINVNSNDAKRQLMVENVCTFTYLRENMDSGRVNTRSVPGHPIRNMFVLSNSTASEPKVMLDKDDPANSMIILPVDETYKTLWLKTRMFWKFVGDHVDTLFEGCDWFVKLDDDTYMKWTLFRKILACRDPMENLYSGYFGRGRLFYHHPNETHRTNENRKELMTAVGAMYFISRGVAVKLSKWIKKSYTTWPQWNFERRCALGRLGEDSCFAALMVENGVCYDSTIANPWIAMEFSQVYLSDVTKEEHILEQMEPFIEPLPKNSMNCMMIFHKIPPAMYPFISMELYRRDKKYAECQYHQCYNRNRSIGPSDPYNDTTQNACSFPNGGVKRRFYSPRATRKIWCNGTECTCNQIRHIWNIVPNPGPHSKSNPVWDLSNLHRKFHQWWFMRCKYFRDEVVHKIENMAPSQAILKYRELKVNREVPTIVIGKENVVNTETVTVIDDVKIPNKNENLISSNAEKAKHTRPGNICSFILLRDIESPFRKVHRRIADFPKRNWFVSSDRKLSKEVIRNDVEDPANSDIILPLKETYDTLWLKSKAMWSFIGENVDTHFSECDWFMKIDDDTYTNFKLLKEALACRDPMKPLYSGFFSRGHMQYSTSDGLSLKSLLTAVGAHYFISRSIALSLNSWFQTSKNALEYWGFQERCEMGYLGEDSCFSALMVANGVCYDSIIADPWIAMEWSQVYFTENVSSKEDIRDQMEPLIEDSANDVKNCVTFLHKAPLHFFETIQAELRDREQKYPPCKYHQCVGRTTHPPANPVDKKCSLVEGGVRRKFKASRKSPKLW